MKKKEAETYARNHLASKLELCSVSPPLSIGLRNKTLADDCYWFDFRFPDECWIGGGWVIGVRKTDGSLAYFGMDGME